MHYERSYKDIKNLHARDTKAIDDIREYLGEERWEIVLDMLIDPKSRIDNINMALGFAGVAGFPFHALCRKYRLAQYREWMAAGSDGMNTDEMGFSVEGGG